MDARALELPKQKKPEKAITVLSKKFLFTETGIAESAESAETLCKMVSEPGALGEDMMKYARESRVSVNADDSQEVLLAIVWVLQNGKQLFRAFSEVMFIDGTHKTNKENRPLITMGMH